MIVLACGVAHATPAAEELFREGRELMRQRKLAEACDRFERSNKLEPRVGTLLNLADCRERLGQTASAWEAFENARALALQVGDARRAAEAERRAAGVQPRLAFVIVTVPEASRVPSLTIRRGDTAIDPAAWNAKLPLDPGRYTVSASAPGRLPWTKTIALAERATLEVDVPALAIDPAAVRAAPAAPVTTRPHDPPFRSAGVGAFAGVTHSEDAVLGARVLGAIAMPGGALRGVVMFYRFRDSRDPDASQTYAIGTAADYVRPVFPQLAAAAGIGIGADFDRFGPGSASENDTSGWIALRASPLIARVDRGHLELGLHVHLVLAGDEATLLVFAGVDVLP